ncbi:PPE family protein [Mycobacterium sp.]|uniref:PPE family protein n=1 Tax=Mycobacterium sp. TaxID=1785 RepID=UPI002CC2D5D7|nr:PPE family protein [Mycobacterium sp.]HTQ19100.1 PPE family protein [Mycobacterium sp.]
MTAAIWMAAPPEVHSTLLSSGPGPGSLLAAAESWTSLSTVYTETAEELAALVAAVQAGAWEGPTAAAYAAGHAPYVAWLTQAAADSTAMAARQEIAATAYTSALAAMPTLAELAANHATHAVLLATNFFGINTIPIALNEADYIRMWIQAATVMGTYHAVSTAAVASSPQTTAAPQIVNLQALVDAFYQAFPLPSDTQTQVSDWLQSIGFIDFYNNVLDPLANALYNNPFLASMFAGIDPYLPLLGNPLIFLSPFNIAFALGYPMDIGSYVAYLSQTFSFIALDLTAAFASGNPAAIGLTIVFTTVEAIGTIITDTIALLKTLLEQTAVLLVVFVPLLTAPLVTLAAGVALAPAGLTGLAALAAVPPPAPPVVPSFTPPLAALAPSVPTSPTSPAPAPVEATAAAPASAAPPPPTGAPPTLTGAGVSATMGAGMGMGAGVENFGYLVGDLNSAVGRAAGTRARKKAPEPDSAEAPTVAPTPKEDAQPQRRRRTKVQMLGRGYEYMDLEPSDTGAGTQGFAGTAAKAEAGPAAGLITLADDGFGGGPRLPMMPGTWSDD